MSFSGQRFWAGVTIALIALLHAFTHAFQGLLVPLYLLVQKNLNLPRVGDVAFIITLYNLVYFAASFFSGMLADRCNRKALLGIGLIGNAIAIGLMGVTGRYELLVLLGIVAGLFGTLFHPAANALASAHYPGHPGLAIGIIGIGTGVGFYVGPRFSGWRAEMAGWQRPMLEAGIVGVIVGVLFLLLAREVGKPGNGGGAVAEDAAPPVRRPLSWSMRGRVVASALVLGWRDFAAQAMMTLVSLFLLQAQGRTVAQTGALLGTMTLSGVIITPLSVWISPRRRRLPALVGVLIVGGVLLAIVPRVAPAWTLTLLGFQQACSMASFALGDAAMLERVPLEIRGRVMGLFLTVAATLGSSGPYLMGLWTDRMGADGVRDPANYFAPFTLIGGMMAASALSAMLIARYGKPDRAEDPEGEAERRAAMSPEV